MSDVIHRPHAATSLGFVLVALAAATWASDGLFRRGLALELPAGTVVMIEHVILVAITLPLLARAVSLIGMFGYRDWIALGTIGAGASALATVLFTQAFVHGDPNTPLLLQKLQPLFAIGGATLLLRERLLPRFGIYLICALVGAYLVSFPEPTNVSISAFTPAALSVAAAALWGFGTVLGRHLTAKVDFASLTALRFAIGLPATIAIVALQDGGDAISTIGGRDALALLLLALIPGLLGLLLYYRGLRDTPASAATLAELVFPISAITINYLAFEATLVTSQWLGVFILSATITAMGLVSSRGTHAIGIELTAPAVAEEPARAWVMTNGGSLRRTRGREL
jgi:drug/metabolite transporter, DME family